VAAPVKDGALLAAVGRWGAALAFVVVAASALLRLGTSLDAGGNAASTLAPALESSARIVHRAAASAVGLLVIAALALALRQRPVPCRRRAALAAIVVCTLGLAAIGRYTPGYRFAGVTVANAVLGVALACGFASLAVERQTAIRPAYVIGILAVLAQVGLGSAASAEAMHGRLAFEPLHVALGPVVAAVVAWIAVRDRGWIAVLAVLQMALGMALMVPGAARGLPGEWLHAMLACALAVVLAVRVPVPSKV